MNRIFGFLCLLSVSVFTFAQNNETRNLKHFTKVKAYGPVNIILHQSDVEKAKISANGMETRDVELSVSGGTLRIKLKGDMFEEKAVTIDLYYSELTELFIAAGADATSNKPIQANDLEIHATSGSILEMEFASGNIDVNISEGAIAELVGSVDRMQVRAATGGILKAFNLAADNVSVKANTGAVVRVEASDKLDIKANLGGIVHYRGEPKDFSSEITLGGVIKKDG